MTELIECCEAQKGDQLGLHREGRRERQMRRRDRSLDDINMALSEGVFRSLTGGELSRRVKAVFQDSEGKMKLLRLLESN